MNHLNHEKSPYLLQHAENPVDWYPWCDEAFTLAAEKDIPIFLSIGYSTCHWCHVMAHESFEDPEVAEILADGFVAVKVDREERPDIDSVYMSVCQAMTGSGGWPLTIIMTPDKKPFFAGTYFPKHNRFGSPGLIELLNAVSDKWAANRKSLLEQSDVVVDFLKAQEAAGRSAGGRTGSGDDSADNAAADSGAQNQIDPCALIEGGLAYFTKTFDKKNGGFGASPKFPSPHNLLFLMGQKGRKGEKYLTMAEKTLEQMYRGGIFDHIGGGFSRYSTDEKWLVPHFEKMLYDNALLLLTYSQAWQETGSSLYRYVAERTAAYVKRELTDPEGGFYCGQDADSDGAEGKYYVFTPEEIRSLLHLEPAAAFCARYDITPGGNFEGKSIPNLLSADNWTALPDEDLLRILQEYRLERTVLHRDDKVLTSWNGLMIAALAKSARQLKNAEFLEAALTCCNFLLKNLHRGDGSLFARWRQGHQAFDGTLDDYAFFCWGLLECYSTTFNPYYLQQADFIGRKMLELFFDDADGGCYLYGKDSEQLFIRPKETFDGAVPSGNSVAALVMKKLAFFTGEAVWEQAYAKQSAFMQSKCREQAAGHSFYLWVLNEELSEDGQLICAMNEMESLPPETLCELWNLDMDILLKTPETQELLHQISPYMEHYPIPQDGASYYYCKGHVCSSPVHSLEELEELADLC